MNDAVARRLADVGVHVPRILLPRSDVDLRRWAVIACDQHTSEPEYWDEVARVVGDHPSSLNMIYPEVYLNEPRPDDRIARIHDTMRRYLEENVVEETDPTMILTVRSTPHVSERRGLVLALDLDRYEYTPGAQSLIRATERTIVERIPPRVRIREGAPVEVPHVMVLVDDADNELFGGLEERDLERVYDTDLMLGGGRVRGYRVDGAGLDRVAGTLEALVARSGDESGDETGGQDAFLFAVGDGNHSLATAKAVWDATKANVSPDHPARYALVEVVNIYDPGLRFEPIHRLVRCDDPIGWVDELATALGSPARECSRSKLQRELGRNPASVGYVTNGHCGTIVPAATEELPVAAVQSYINEQSDTDVDYIHGWDASLRLGSEPNAVTIILPPFDRRLLYPTVAKRGVLPRKAFSLGDAEEKRYYLEARRIV